jgi:hypothetical protein
MLRGAGREEQRRNKRDSSPHGIPGKGPKLKL